MLGLILSLLYGAYLFLVFYSLETAYLGSTVFLFRWTLVWSVVLGIALLLTNFLILFAGTAVGSIAGIAGALVGFLTGGAASLFLLAIFLFRRCLYVGGAYLLSTALVLQNGDYVWNTPRLILGTILFVIAIIARRAQVSS